MRLPIAALLLPIVLLGLAVIFGCEDKLPALEEANQQLREIEAETAVAIQQEQNAPRGSAGQSNTSDSSRQGEPPPGSAPNYPIRIDAKTLVYQFWANKVRFKRDYASRWYLISGKVKMITDDSIIFEAFWSGRPIARTLEMPAQTSAEADILSATVGEQFTTTCYLRSSTMVRDFYELVDCAKGWNR